jgi:endonuclease/exonuclease/phosphatase family metal-dependent hydrolase
MPMLDTFAAANPDAQYSSTTNTGYRVKKNTSQIDYVFVPVGSKVHASSIIYYQDGGVYPSDHYPLISEFELE